MNSYESLDQLKLAFLAGKVNFPENIRVIGLDYRLRGSSKFAFEDIVTKNYKGVVVYSVGNMHREEAVKVGLDQWLLFIWAFNANQQLVPAAVIPTTRHRGAAEVAGNVAIDVSEAQTRDDNLIGDTVAVRFTTLPGTNALKGKVDTGAEISSLHVDKWSINGNKVQFISKVLSPNTITMSLYDHQAVKSVAGVQYRPIVELNVRVNDRLLSGVLFNLADRGSMEFPVLVGKNILQKGKFLIDPSMTEGEEAIDWEAIQEAVKDITPPDTAYDENKAQAVYQMLKDNDLSFDDLIRYIRTEVTSVYEDIKY